jgi:xanthine/uracil permease
LESGEESTGSVVEVNGAADRVRIRRPSIVAAPLFIVAVAIGFGMIPLIAPNFKMWMPHAIHPLIESGILLASIVAVVLNAFFNGAKGSVDEAKAAASAADH